MKVCESCGDEIGTKDGENRCEKCENEQSKAKKAVRNKARRERDQVMRDCGLVKVRGAMGGTFWE
jgi:hypothetical protein